MNHMMKSVVLSGVLMLCALVVGCAATPASQPSASQPSESQSSDDLVSPLTLPNTCSDQFCRQAEGPGWIRGSATSELTCEQRNGFWFPSGDIFMGPPPGCCCVCGFLPPLECA